MARPAPGHGRKEADTAVWELAERQQGVVARSQLLTLGLSDHQLSRRLAAGSLRPLWRGVYAVGGVKPTAVRRLMAAILICGPQAALSHGSAAALWGFGREGEEIELSLRRRAQVRRRGLVVHGRPSLPAADVVALRGLALTTPARTLLDLAARPGGNRLGPAVKAAARLGLVEPAGLREFVSGRPGEPGGAALRELLRGP